ncbi:DMT family transporter [Roseomonas xinghualingensis]|uniref:DMT family transporter n=1 Tax=Roseomonas xinghualingensis TaxID=2986475 RepID=UPI0021F0B5BE|nr:DMT family transporter [Roseomonas sp. SXEYE001]MCV4209052.1 DMT family transporter [Roseomonas sp. SXEYE001]
MNPRDLRLLLLAVVLFGGAWPITKDALREATPVWFAVSRAGLAALATAAALALMGRLHWPGRRDWPVVVAVGLLQLGTFFALSHLALAILSSGRIAVLSNVTIYWLVPLSVLVLGEKVSAMRWAAAGLGLAGAAVLMGPWAIDWSHEGVVFAHGLLLLAALAWSIAIVVTRRLPPSRPMLEMLPFCFGIGTLVLVPLALWREPGGGIGSGAWMHAAFMGCIAAPIGTWSVIEAGRRLPSTVASVGFMLVPVFGVTLGAFWLGEHVGWDVWAGGALIAASMVLAVRG